MATRQNVKWEDLPERPPLGGGRGRPDKYKAIIEQLDKRPGKWAVIATSIHSSMAQYLGKRYPDYEFATRGNNKRTRRAAKLYARRRPTTEE